MDICKVSGLQAYSPPIRSSDMAYDPFHYLLARRLAIVQPNVYSVALNRGSWAHLALTVLAYRRPDDSCSPSDEFRQQVEDACSKLNAALKEAGMPERLRMDALEREKIDAYSAWSWVNASMSYKLAGGSLANGWGPLLNVGTDGEWQWLGAEVLLDFMVGQIPCRAQLDHLLFNRKTKHLWPLDLKTCSEPATMRLKVVSFEWQTRHYLTACACELPHIIKRFNLPPDTQLAGMFHLALQKPSIVFGDRDRPYAWVASSKRSNLTLRAQPNTLGTWSIVQLRTDSGEVLDPVGETTPMTRPNESEAIAACEAGTGVKAKKEFDGNPSHENYTKRCADWYCGAGDYAHELDRRMEGDSMPVNFSRTAATTILDKRMDQEYLNRLNWVNCLRECRMDIENFDRDPSSLRSPFGITPYALFFTTNPSLWKRLIAQEGFIIRSREEVWGPHSHELAGASQ